MKVDNHKIEKKKKHTNLIKQKAQSLIKVIKCVCL